MNFVVFKRMGATVLLSGFLAGVLLTAVQRLQVTGLIQQAEVYEAAAEVKSTTPDYLATHVENVGHEQASATHHHDEPEWEPANGLERTFYTLLANICIGIGFALFLVAAMCVRGRQLGWWTGIAWGVAGYLVFFVAPSLGLPPELPGTQAAPLHDRQLWWIMAAGLTAFGLGLLVYVRPVWLKCVGLILLIVPHWVGAPQPEMHGGLAPEILGRAFIEATAIAQGLFWLALGGMTGFFYRKFS